MCFAGRVGAQVDLDSIVGGTATEVQAFEALFAEELGAVLQVESVRVRELERKLGLAVLDLGPVATDRSETIVFRAMGSVWLKGTRAEFQKHWAETSYLIQSIRDNRECAEQEYENISDLSDAGLAYELTFTPAEDTSAMVKQPSYRPRVAILREQGVNGHVEMAYSFHAAGFTAVDVHMSDLLSGEVDLADFVGLAACGGFSYGDVLGAGAGWAKSVILNSKIREEVRRFAFERKDTFLLGVCNGCQMLSQLRELIPGADRWPLFTTNRSERFEARFSMVEVAAEGSPATKVFFAGMGGSRLPIPVAHGEGLAVFSPGDLAELERAGLVAMRYIGTDHASAGGATQRYPYNPNGSPAGVTGVVTPDGRVLAMMPHPERATRTATLSWAPDGEKERWGEHGPWMRMFRNARRWVG
ncbi:MAG: Phosphoribosylformylglycinamidine synthase [Olpidium bornovanus]|uniref:Phosphoribosylformylglycinamidine synthase n=1 Tax=Olpidium bornovanus TaxID=278681 RepID=A0A8H8A030_9FUNG|nr:MAG: Phosphoribosylformylglycinamidine synthase [Olpidium bornovanus]